MGGILLIDGSNIFHVISGFGNTFSVIRDLRISFNDALTSTSGFENLASIAERLIMPLNRMFHAIEGFPNIHPLGGDLITDSNQRSLKAANLTSLVFL